MSANRRYNRRLALPKVLEAEIRAGKKQVGNLYFEFKRRVIVEKPDQLTLRQMLCDYMDRVRNEVKSEPVKVAYLRGFKIMLDKVGGPIKSADDLYDEAVGDVKDGPTEESIRQAMQMLGMKPPADSEAPGAPSEGSPAGPLAGAADESPARPRFRRTYPSITPDEAAPPSTGPADPSDPA